MDRDWCFAKGAVVGGRFSRSLTYNGRDLTGVLPLVSACLRHPLSAHDSSPPLPEVMKKSVPKGTGLDPSRSARHRLGKAEPLPCRPNANRAAVACWRFQAFGLLVEEALALRLEIVVKLRTRCALQSKAGHVRPPRQPRERNLRRAVPSPRAFAIRTGPSGNPDALVERYRERQFSRSSPTCRQAPRT